MPVGRRRASTCSTKCGAIVGWRFARERDALGARDVGVSAADSQPRSTIVAGCARLRGRAPPDRATGCSGVGCCGRAARNAASAGVSVAAPRPKYATRRALGALDLIPVRREVQIEREDLVLRQPMLEPKRDDSLASLRQPPVRDVAARLPREQQLRDLLRDRRAAFDDSAARADRARPRARSRSDRCPHVRSEAHVLGRQRRRHERLAGRRAARADRRACRASIALRTAARRADRRTTVEGLVSRESSRPAGSAAAPQSRRRRRAQCRRAVAPPQFTARRCTRREARTRCTHSRRSIARSPSPDLTR